MPKTTPKSNYIFFIAIIVGLIACTQGTIESNADEQTDTSSMFLGVWQSTERIIPYKATLSINNDNTFHFTYDACPISGFSIGTWILKDGIITLNSLPADTCLFVREFGEDCYTIEQLEGFNLETTIPDCKPEEPGEFVLFQNVKFQLIGDTLRHFIIGERICPEIRNDFFRP
jgi:hypothetical protein